jgi:hypothetical protein
VQLSKQFTLGNLREQFGSGRVFGSHDSPRYASVLMRKQFLCGSNCWLGAYNIDNFFDVTV